MSASIFVNAPKKRPMRRTPARFKEEYAEKNKGEVRYEDKLRRTQAKLRNRESRISNLLQTVRDLKKQNKKELSDERKARADELRSSRRALSIYKWKLSNALTSKVKYRTRTTHKIKYKEILPEYNIPALTKMLDRRREMFLKEDSILYESIIILNNFLKEYSLANDCQLTQDHYLILSQVFFIVDSGLKGVHYTRIEVGSLGKTTISSRLKELVKVGLITYERGYANTTLLGEQLIRDIRLKVKLNKSKIPETLFNISSKPVYSNEGT